MVLFLFSFEIDYNYDAQNRRIASTTSVLGDSNTTYHIYDGTHVLADTRSNGRILRRYIYGPGTDNLLAIIVGGDIYYCLSDQQNTIHALMRARDNLIIERYIYDPFGNIIAIYDCYNNLTPHSIVGNRYRW